MKLTEKKEYKIIVSKFCKTMQILEKKKIDIVYAEYLILSILGNVIIEKHGEKFFKKVIKEILENKNN